MLWSFIIGLVAGWLANIAVRGGGYGIIANMLVGVVGALLGSWVAQMFSYDGLSAWGVVISSAVGAIVLLVFVAIITKWTKNGDD